MTKKIENIVIGGILIATALMIMAYFIQQIFITATTLVVVCATSALYVLVVSVCLLFVEIILLLVGSIADCLARKNKNN